MGDGVNILNMHIFRYVQADGGVVQNGFHTRFNELIGGFLCGSGRDAEHGDLDLVLFGLFDHAPRVENLKVSYFLPDLVRVVIECHIDVKAAIGKTVIVSEGVSDIPHANDHYFPNPIHFQDITQSFDKKRH